MSKDVNDKKAWEAAFIKPIAKVMKDRGIGYLLITLRNDGKAAYVMEPMEEECPHNTGHELNGVGMWICLGCRADITPELSPSNDERTHPLPGASRRNQGEVSNYDQNSNKGAGSGLL
jgi:hypothetical protein